MSHIFCRCTGVAFNHIQRNKTATVTPPVLYMYYDSLSITS